MREGTLEMPIVCITLSLILCHLAATGLRTTGAIVLVLPEGVSSFPQDMLSSECVTRTYSATVNNSEDMELSRKSIDLSSNVILS